MDLSLSVCAGLSQPGYQRVDDEHQLDTDAELVAEAVGNISNESALANSYSASNSSLNPERQAGRLLVRISQSTRKRR